MLSYPNKTDGWFVEVHPKKTPRTDNKFVIDWDLGQVQIQIFHAMKPNSPYVYKEFALTAANFEDDFQSTLKAAMRRIDLLNMTEFDHKEEQGDCANCERGAAAEGDYLCPDCRNERNEQDEDLPI